MTKINHGFVLTCANDLSEIATMFNAGKYNTIKVVTGWGLQGGWNADSCASICHMAQTVIVRTVSSDGDEGNLRTLDPGKVVAEIAPWWNAGKNIIVELGNEPNSKNAGISNQNDWWAWQAVFQECVKMLKTTYSGIKVISPGWMEDSSGQSPLSQWMWQVIAQDNVFKDCDAIGIHAYAGTAFDDLGQLRSALARAKPLGKPIWLTEYGINATIDPARKGQAYAALVRSLEDQIAAAILYQVDTCDQNDASYSLPLQGHQAYGQAIG